jgi:prepilin-type N-terminal cleavage/methylation domain-containing protein
MGKIKRDLGFTLVELIIVIALIGVLSALALPKFANLKGASEVNFVNGVINALTIGRERWRSAWTGVNGSSGSGVDGLTGYYMSMPLTNSSSQNEYYLKLNSQGYPNGSPISTDSPIAGPSGYTGFNFKGGARDLPSEGPPEIAIMCARIFFNLINNPNISIGHSSSISGFYKDDFLYDATCPTVPISTTPSTKSTFCVLPAFTYSNSDRCYYQYQGNTAIYILYTPSTGIISYGP